MNKEQLIETLLDRIKTEFDYITEEQWEDVDNAFFECFEHVEGVELVQDNELENKRWYSVRSKIFNFREGLTTTYFRVIDYYSKTEEATAADMDLFQKIDDIRIAHPTLVQVTKYIIEGEGDGEANN